MSWGLYTLGCEPDTINMYMYQAHYMLRFIRSFSVHNVLNAASIDLVFVHKDTRLYRRYKMK